jgi:hypothetical protein
MTGTEFAGAAVAALLDTLWVALAIAAAAWALARFLPRTNAATRHLLWWTVLALVLICLSEMDRRRRRWRARTPLARPAVTAPRAQATIAPAVFPARRRRGRFFPRIPHRTTGSAQSHGASGDCSAWGNSCGSPGVSRISTR